jgi:hypothetical protein
MSVWATLGTSGGEEHVYVASSATGQMVISASSATTNAGIGISQDYGTTWSYSASTANNVFTGVAVSKDGTVFLAIYGNTILRSTNLGATWTSTTTSLNNLWIGTFDGTIITTDQYQSLNGTTYTAFGGSGQSVICASANGSLLLAKSGTGVAGTSALSRSIDHGATWTQIFFNLSGTISGSNGDFGSAASSADGTHLGVAWRIASGSTCFLYLSSNGGIGWSTAPTSGGVFSGLGYWSGVACTSDGSVFLASNYAATGGGHAGPPNYAVLLATDGTVASTTSNTSAMSFVTSATISDDSNYAIIGGGGGIYRLYEINPQVVATSVSTSNLVGKSYATAIINTTSTSSTSLSARSIATGILAAPSTSTSALATKQITTQPLVATSVSTANIVGGSRATAILAASSASTSNIQAGAIVRAAVASASISGSSLQSAILAHSIKTLPTAIYTGGAVYTPQPVIGIGLDSLPRPVLHGLVGYVAGPITATITWKISRPISHGITAYTPFAITASTHNTLPPPTFSGGSSLVDVLNIYLWGAQIEAGPGATSYIPTTGTAITRAADNLLITTVINPYVVTLDTLVLCSLAQAILDYTPQTSNEAVSILNQYINLFDTTIAPASDLNWIATVSALTKLRTSVLQYLQQQISVEPTIQLQNFGDQVPAAVAAYILFGDSSRTDELVATNDPVNPLYMPLQVTYNNA